MVRMRKAALVVRDNGRGLVALASLFGIGVGFWWYSPSLGLIVPCAVVFSALAWSHLRGAG